MTFDGQISADSQGTLVTDWLAEYSLILSFQILPTASCLQAPLEPAHNFTLEVNRSHHKF